MEVRFFDDMDVFAGAVGPYLGAHEAENNLPIGIVATIRSGQYLESTPLLMTIEDGIELVGVALRTPPHDLVLSFDLSRGAIDVLARTLQERGAVLPGAIADVATASAFSDVWARLRGVRFELSVSERIYRLDSVRTSRRANGSMRPATEEDHTLAMRWIDGFARDTGRAGSGDLVASTSQFIPEQPGVRGMVLWEVDDQPVSMAAFTGPTANGMRVSVVYTPPELRGRGYASACVAALSQQLLDDGRQFCFLFTDLANPTSNHIYREIGYQPVCDVSLYRVPDSP